MTRIKICGITDPEDALAAIDYGANALGFIFVPESPRFVGKAFTADSFSELAFVQTAPQSMVPVRDGASYIGMDEAMTVLLMTLPPFVTRTAVCLTPEHLAYNIREQFDAFQFYQQDSPLLLNKSNIRAFRIQDQDSLREIETVLRREREQTYEYANALLLDTYHQDKLGGSGETFNWELAVEAKERFRLPIILAGGLTPDNVEEAIAAVRPYAVDVSSGVEAEPGRKDHARMKAFCQAVQRANNAIDR